MRNTFKTLTLLAASCILASCGQSSGGNTDGSLNTFIMEAEYIDFTGIVGGGNSSEQRETNMIYGDGTDVEKNEYGWSNGYFVAYTHKAGICLEFDFKSDKAVNDATLVLRMASEMGTVSIGPDEFEIKLNDTVIDYNPQYLDNYPTLDTMRFKDKTISSTAQIKAGDNVLTLTVKENNLTGAGTIGPILDCVKITSKAQLSWEPKTDNPDHRGEI